MLNDPRVHVVDYDGRLYLAGHPDSYDVVDLSLADSAGLSAPGGFAIVEKYAYTREAMETYMRALKPGGVLSVTLWNKEEPPKSVLKLYSTMAEAARALDPEGMSRDFFAVSTYLSTATVLYKRGGFTDAEIAALRDHTKAMSFDEIYSPGIAFDAAQTDSVLANYRGAIFSDAPAPAPGKAAEGASAAAADDTGGDEGGAAAPTALPPTLMGRLAWHALIFGGWDDIARRYVFDARPLTNDRPYFAAYVKPKDLPNLLDRLEIVQDEWGYLLLWATLGIAAIAAVSLVAIPVVFGWRSIFSRAPGKGGTILYFACLGLGYIIVEVALIAQLHAGPQQRHRVGLRADHLHAGLLRPRQPRGRAHPRPASGLPAADPARHRADPDRLRPVPRPCPDADRHLALRAAAADLLPHGRAAGLPDGLPDADRHDHAGPARQGAHVPVGLGHQRLLLGDRRRGGAARSPPRSGSRAC